MGDVVLVDKKNNQIGTEDKLEAHKNGGRLHRAFSIFIFNSEGELLLQKRAPEKYHSEGLWTNTCCSHPNPGEDLKEAVERRLQEEMGFQCEVKKIFDFIYKAKFEELTEKEFDNVLIGRSDQEPEPNPEEVLEWKWMKMEEIKEDLKKNPKKYTPWFQICFSKVFDYYNSNLK